MIIKNFTLVTLKMICMMVLENIGLQTINTTKVNLSKENLMDLELDTSLIKKFTTVHGKINKCMDGED